MSYKTIILLSICVGLIAFLTLLILNHILKQQGVFTKFNSELVVILQAIASILLVITSIGMIIVVARQVDIMQKKFVIDYAPMLNIEPQKFKDKDSYFYITRESSTEMTLKLVFKITNEGNTASFHQGVTVKDMTAHFNADKRRTFVTGECIGRIVPETTNIIFPDKSTLIYYSSLPIDIKSEDKEINADYVNFELELKYRAVMHNKEKIYTTRAKFEITDMTYKVLEIDLPELT